MTPKKHNITYLLGAGASAGCLPVVEDIPKRLEALIEKIKSPQMQLEGRYPNVETFSKADLQGQMIIDLQWLLDKSDGHSSIDTFAKKLFLIDAEKELTKLKFTTSVFFSCIQMITRPDKRYDSFLASVLKKQGDPFPSNVNIISWNYDNQFEIAYSQFSRNADIRSNVKALNIKAKYERDSMRAGFSIFKLNGSAGYMEDSVVGVSAIAPTYVPDLPKETLETIVYNYTWGVYPEKIKRYKLSSTLSFAWENDNSTDDLFKHLQHAVSKTSILIIIGYSFPFFNRDIDKQILTYMTQLNKVYFQSLDDIAILRSRVKSACENDINDDSMIKIDDLKQFYIPSEF